MKLISQRNAGTVVAPATPQGGLAHTLTFLAYCRISWAPATSSATLTVPLLSMS